MNEEKKPKVMRKILLLVILVLIILGGIFVFYNTDLKNIFSQNNDVKYTEKVINGKTYYQRIGTETWKGRYHQDEFRTEESVDSVMEVLSYVQYLDKLEEVNSLIEGEIKQHYGDENSNYIVLTYASGFSWCEMDLIDCVAEGSKVIIYGDEKIDGVMADGTGYFIVIPTDMPDGVEVEYRECYSEEEIKNLKKYDTPYDPWQTTLDKPIIYLYPTEDVKLTVKLTNADKITCSYPEYTDGWNVLAKTTGELVDLETNRNLYALYYESKSDYDFEIQEDGFVVKGSEVTKFLEEKLAILGLTEREVEEFIIYWLPVLQENEYNYIRFATTEEINQSMPLEFSVKPDTLIRVLMTYKKLDGVIKVQEQQLETPERTGFVAVEWGGIEIR